MKITGVDDFFHVLLDDWKEDEMKEILIKFWKPIEDALSFDFSCANIRFHLFNSKFELLL
jgi:hypothetical protein